MGNEVDGFMRLTRASRSIHGFNEVDAINRTGNVHEDAGNILSLFEVGSDGRNPYQRLRGKKTKQPLVEFGESMHFLTPDHGSLGQMESKWRNGIYLGICMESSEMLVGTSEGVFKVRSIRRKPDGQGRDADHFCSVIGIPWKPYQLTGNDRLLIGLPEFSESKDVEVKERPPDEDPAQGASSLARRI